MNNNDKNLIEKYIDGELKGVDLIMFEKKLKTDKSLAKEYEQRIDIAKLWVDAYDYRATKAEISNVLHNSEMNFFKSNRYLIFSIAASIIILLGVYFLMDHDNANISNEFANVNDSIINRENSIVFQYDDPNKFSTIDTVVDNIELLFPINGKTFNKSEIITFKWKSNLKQVDTLFVCNISNSKILLKFIIRLTDSTYTIKHPQFSEGNYIWYISNNTNYKEFTLIK
jgi:hypothetical protein